MSGKWERTFEIAVPVERVWEAMTNREELQVLFTPPEGKGLDDGMPTMELLEAIPLKKLRWSQDRDKMPDKVEFTVVFESREIGSTITVTRYGFGEGEDADLFHTSFGLGVEHGYRDLILYLETGHLAHRHYNGCSLSAMGMAYEETPAGVRVCQVGEKGLAADAGLERGDRIVRIGNAPVYTRSDMWMLNSIHPEGTELDVEFLRDRELMHAKGRTCGLSSRLIGE
jgi:C-terminal processing protease CtpA/Prc